MVFLRAISSIENTPVVQGSKVYLRAPLLGDYEAWASVRARSRAFLTPWEPSWPSDDLTRQAFRSRIRRYHRDIREDASYPFFIFEIGSDVLTGGLTISNIRRGVAQSGSLGYWMGVDSAGHGYMTDAVRAVTAYAFGTLGLNRLEAACLPNNAPSIRLLKRCGFTEEGYARAYLKINGRWQDHVTFALLASDPLV